MTDHCRVCGDHLGERNPFALEMLNLSTWPEWLDGLCLGCLYEMQRDEGEGPTTILHLNAFLAQSFALLAFRAGNSLSLDHCEVASGGHFIGDPIMNCRRFKSHTIAGRRVCGVHFGLSKRGVALKFVEEDRRRPQPYVIWARDEQELIIGVRRLAPLFASHELPSAQSTGK